MKIKTNMQIIVALFVIALLFAFVSPVAAQEATPPEGSVFLTPEFTVWAESVATRGGWLAMVILLDLVLGVTLAVKLGTFQWQKLADFLGDYGPKIVGWLCLELFTLLPPDLAAMAGLGSALGMGAYTIIMLSAVGGVLTNVQSLGLLPVNVPGLKPSVRG